MNDTYCAYDSGSQPSFGSDVKPVIGTAMDYNLASNKPSINGVILEGNKSNEELKITAISNEEIENLLKQFK